MDLLENHLEWLEIEAKNLAEEDYIDLDNIDTSDFANHLDNWVRTGRLPLPNDHPLQTGSFRYNNKFSAIANLNRAGKKFVNQREKRKARNTGSKPSSETCEPGQNERNHHSTPRGELAEEIYFGEEPDEERIPDEDAPPTLFWRRTG